MNDYLKKLLHVQIDGIAAIDNILNDDFEAIANVVAKCDGHVIITGLGKSGIVGKKISATMSSIGVPSFFLCPFNATHGDIGMLTKQDVVILISNSGNAGELVAINEYCRKNGNLTIGITRNENSCIANETNYRIVLPKMSEGNEWDAPATSTTQTIVIGDILALAASKIKNFTKVDYAKLHPSGSLGKQVSKVTNVMNGNFCTVEIDCSMMEIAQKMTEHSNGFVCVVDGGKLCGIITDGDIRRAILKHGGEIKHLKAAEICGKNPKFLTAQHYISDAENLIKTYKIGQVIVVDGNGMPVGFVSKYGV